MMENLTFSFSLHFAQDSERHFGKKLILRGACPEPAFGFRTEDMVYARVRYNTGFGIFANFRSLFLIKI